MITKKGDYVVDVNEVIMELNITEKLVNDRHKGGNKWPIFIFNSFFVTFYEWKGLLLTFILPKWFIHWCRSFSLIVTNRKDSRGCDKPDILLKKDDDTNSETKIFKFAGSTYNPFKRFTKDNIYNCLEYMKEENIICEKVKLKYADYLASRK